MEKKSLVFMKTDISNSKNNPAITGIFAPVPTPFDGEENIYFEKFEENLHKWALTPLTGIVVLGSNGEFVSLSGREKVDVISFVRENFPADRPVIAGTGCESTIETIRLTREASDAGVQAALVVNPRYYRSAMTDQALEAHYFRIADSSAVPIMIYNMPGNTGINMSADLLVKLSQHPNIQGVKDSGGNIVQISSVIKGTSSDFSVFAGSGSYLLPVLLMGGVGATMAVANVAPEHCVNICKAFQNGDMEKARNMQLDLLDLNTAVTKKYGIAGLKYVLDRRGYYGGPCRMPLTPLSSDSKHEVDIILEKFDSISYQ